MLSSVMLRSTPSRPFYLPCTWRVQPAVGSGGTRRARAEGSAVGCGAMRRDPQLAAEGRAAAPFPILCGGRWALGEAKCGGCCLGTPLARSPRCSRGPCLPVGAMWLVFWPLLADHVRIKDRPPLACSRIYLFISALSWIFAAAEEWRAACTLGYGSTVWGQEDGVPTPGSLTSWGLSSV